MHPLKQAKLELETNLKRSDRQLREGGYYLIIFIALLVLLEIWAKLFPTMPGFGK